MSLNLKKIESDIYNTATIGNLSSIFEITSTIKINETKNNVFASQKFYIDLWNLYTELLNATESKDLPTRNVSIDRTVCLVVTSSGSFSGPADDEILRLLDSDAETAGSDLVVIGKKGVSILTSKGRKLLIGFDSPDITKPIDVSPLSDLVKKYKNAFCIYQTFISINNQKITKTNLIPSSNVNRKESSINLEDFILEPSYLEIMEYLESVILNISLTQIIFESRLSEYANRFKTTTIINDRAKEALKALNLKYNSAKRRMKDEALRQQIFQGIRG
jgi:F-type H+-transporting ATPase subunit gamma